MAEFRCPYCNQILIVSKGGLSPFGSNWDTLRPMADSSRHRFGDTTPAVPEFTEAKRVTPARPASAESDVFVPLLQASISGLLVLLGSTGAAIAWHWPWWAPLAAGGGTIGIVWYLLLVDHRSMLKTVETIINKDLDGDNKIGPPAPPPTVRVEYHEQDDQRDHYAFADLPTPRRGYAGLVMFARDVINGSSFSERIASANGYSRDAWNELRNEFVEQGWAVWKHPTEPKQGVALAPAGRVVLRQIADGGMPREEFSPDE